MKLWCVITGASATGKNLLYNRIPVKAVQMKSARSVMKLPAGPISFFCNRPAEMIISPAWFYKSFVTHLVLSSIDGSCNKTGVICCFSHFYGYTINQESH